MVRGGGLMKDHDVKKICELHSPPWTRGDNYFIFQITLCSLLEGRCDVG